ncbi:MAG: MBL fold metallo-hydrolase [Candidatus Heimdallarchaeota archaeon]
MKIFKITNNLYEVRLDLEKLGIKNFLSTWIYKDVTFSFLVDPGPSVLIDSLKIALDTLKIGKNDLKYIILTHIHMDHAGGTGKLVSYFPVAKIVCHPRGIKHLVNPERLLALSVKTLGEMAKIYEDIIPIPEERFVTLPDVGEKNIKIIETLGHASHHQSYLFNNILFAGEIGGTHKELAGKFYLRPATPPIFDYDSWKVSIQKLLNENLKNYLICYPHYGKRENAEKMLQTAKNQLSIWVDVIGKFNHLRDDSKFYNIIISELEKIDKLFANIKLLDYKSQDFELIFIRNSINGILNFLDKKRS